MSRCFFILIFLMLLPTLKAAEFFSYAIERTTYAPGETVQAKIIFLQEPLVPLALEQIMLKDSLRNTVRVAPFLKELDNMTFVSFDLPSTVQNGNYTLLFSQALFSDQGITRRVDYSIPFIVEAHVPTLAIFPGIVVLDAQQDFTVKVKTSANAAILNITTSPGIRNMYTTEQELLPRRERSFKFSYGDSYERQENIVLRYGAYQYVIPVLLTTDLRLNETTNVSTPQIEIVSTLEAIEREIAVNEILRGSLDIRNSGTVDVPLRVEVLGVTRVVTVDAPELLAAGTTTSLAIVIDSTNVQAGSYEGDIALFAGSLSRKIPVRITVHSAPEEPPIESPEPEPKKPPKENDLFTFNLSSYEATEEREQSRIGLIVFLFLLLLAAIAIYLFSRRTTKKESFEDYIKKFEKK